MAFNLLVEVGKKCWDAGRCSPCRIPLHFFVCEIIETLYTQFLLGCTTPISPSSTQDPHPGPRLQWSKERCTTAQTIFRRCTEVKAALVPRHSGHGLTSRPGPEPQARRPASVPGTGPVRPSARPLGAGRHLCVRPPPPHRWTRPHASDASAAARRQSAPACRLGGSGAASAIGKTGRALPAPGGRSGERVGSGE